MELKMFGDRIVFEPIEEDDDTDLEKTDSGLFVPSQVSDQVKQQRRNYKGRAKFVGPDCQYVKEGSVVAYDQFGTADFWHEGRRLVICREKDLIGMYE